MREIKSPLPVGVVIERDVEGEPYDITLQLLNEDGEPCFHLCSLICAMDGHAYGDDEEADEEFDRQQIGYAHRFAASSDLLEVAEAIQAVMGLTIERNFPPIAAMLTAAIAKAKGEVAP